MGGQGVRVDGLKETIRTLEKFGVAVADLKAAFKKIGQGVVDDAKPRIHNASGRLASSIKPSNTKNKSVVRAGSARVPYAGVINYGWPARNIGAQNFLTDAVVAREQETVHIIDEELGSLIRRYGLNN